MSLPVERVRSLSYCWMIFCVAAVARLLEQGLQADAISITMSFIVLITILQFGIGDYAVLNIGKVARDSLGNTDLTKRLCDGLFLNIVFLVSKAGLLFMMASSRSIAPETFGFCASALTAINVVWLLGRLDELSHMIEVNSESSFAAQARVARNAVNTWIKINVAFPAATLAVYTAAASWPAIHGYMHLLVMAIIVVRSGADGLLCYKFYGSVIHGEFSQASLEASVK